MKKNYLLSVLTTVMVAIMGVGFASCSGDGDEGGDIKKDDPKGYITGVVDFDMYKKSNFDELSSTFKIHIDEAKRFVGEEIIYNLEPYLPVRFMSVGYVEDISKINMVSENEQGWSTSMVVNPGYGYLVYNTNADFIDKFMRIYVVDYIKDNSGNVIGAKIKYQLLSSQYIWVDETSFTFTAEGGGKEIKLPCPASYKVENCPDWCAVSEDDVNTIWLSVSENVTPNEKSGQIVLKNNANKVTFSIKQERSSSPLFEGGNGTIENPYQIKTAQQLQNINTKKNVENIEYYPYYYCHFSLISDIDLSSYLSNNEKGWNPIGTYEEPFMGTFDGKNHTISGIWINQPTASNIGLFGHAKEVTIKDIVMKTTDKGITGGYYVGGICGRFSGDISNCSVDGMVSGNDCIGGICGIADAYSKYVTGMGGGLRTYNSKISNCKTKGIIKSSGSRRGEILGGNLNTNYPCYIVGCSSTATLQDK